MTATVLRARDPVEAAALWIARRLRLALAQRGGASVALAGGSTPAAVYARLKEVDLDWGAVAFYFGDERCVPPDHPDSNYSMAEQALLAALRTYEPRVHRMEGEDPDAEAAAERYARLLPPALDLLLLGMGEDGHTASLFPHSPALEESRLVVPVVGPKPPPRRLTITPPVIRAARSKLVLVRGADKARMVALALEGPFDPRERPVQHAQDATWLLDAAAAERLGSTPVEDV